MPGSGKKSLKRPSRFDLHRAGYPFTGNRANLSIRRRTNAAIEWIGRILARRPKAWALDVIREAIEKSALAAPRDEAERLTRELERLEHRSKILRKSIRSRR